MRAVVLGATGAMGSLVCREHRSAGHEVVPVSRATGVDVLTGQGLVQAFEGADVVVDALNIETRAKKKAVGFFETAARNVTAAVREAGASHLVTLSIYNASEPEAQKMGYYAGKAAQERVVRASGVPATIVHSTQWFELAETILNSAKFGPIIVAPAFYSRPAAAEVVAKQIAEVAVGPVQPEGVIIAGPEERDLHELVVELANNRGVKGKILRVNPPGMGAMKSGILVPPSAVPGVGPTFEEWLESH